MLLPEACNSSGLMYYCALEPFFFLCLGLCVCMCVFIRIFFFLFSRSIMIINKKECCQSVKTWTNENHNNITIRKSIIVSYLGSERSEFNALELSCLL